MTSARALNWPGRQQTQVALVELGSETTLVGVESSARLRRSPSQRCRPHPHVFVLFVSFVSRSAAGAAGPTPTPRPPPSHAFLARVFTAVASHPRYACVAPATRGLSAPWGPPSGHDENKCARFARSGETAAREILRIDRLTRRYATY